MVFIAIFAEDLLEPLKVLIIVLEDLLLQEVHMLAAKKASLWQCILREWMMGAVLVFQEVSKQAILTQVLILEYKFVAILIQLEMEVLLALHYLMVAVTQ